MRLLVVISDAMASANVSELLNTLVDENSVQTVTAIGSVLATNKIKAWAQSINIQNIVVLREPASPKEAADQLLNRLNSIDNAVLIWNGHNPKLLRIKSKLQAAGVSYINYNGRYTF